MNDGSGAVTRGLDDGEAILDGAVDEEADDEQQKQRRPHGKAPEGQLLADGGIEVEKRC